MRVADPTPGTVGLVPKGLEECSGVYTNALFCDCCVAVISVSARPLAIVALSFEHALRLTIGDTGFGSLDYERSWSIKKAVP